MTCQVILCAKKKMKQSERDKEWQGKEAATLYLVNMICAQRHDRSLGASCEASWRWSSRAGV